MAVVPLAVVSVLSGLRVTASAQQIGDSRSDRSLIRLAIRLTDLAHSLEEERDLTSRYLADAGNRDSRPDPSGSGIALNRPRQSVDTLIDGTAHLAESEHDLPEIGARQGDLVKETLPKTLSTLRHAVDESQGTFPVSAALRAYGDAIATLIDGLEGLTSATSDPALAERLRTVTALSFGEESISLQRALVAVALEKGTLDTQEQEKLTNATAKRSAMLDYFLVVAEPSERLAYENTVTGRDVDESERIRLLLTNHLAGLTPDGKRSAKVADPRLWYRSITGTTELSRQVRKQIETKVLSAVSAQVNSSIQDTASNSVVLILLLTLTIVVTRSVARSITTPLRSLRSTALNIASTGLPTTVRRLENVQGEPPELDVTPVPVEGTDEIAEVARAFDTVHAEAVRLAVEQSRLRAAVNAMFVNLARRNQSLVQRQLQLIDTLENSERDPDQLENLFLLDHLATRMRRHGEGLLVLADAESYRGQRAPALLLDIARAALGEVEGYKRVAVGSMPETHLASGIIDDTVHLLAELLENALRYSDTASFVEIHARLVDHGDALVEVTDYGLGIAPETLDGINQRLELPGRPDVETSRQMGLFVVARLAARHGMRVALRSSLSLGTVAEVRIPAAMLQSKLPRRIPGSPIAQPPTLQASPMQEATIDSPEGEAISTTVAGEATATDTLPVRVRGSDLVPGSVPESNTSSRGANRSPEAIRAQLSQFHRGLRDGRRHVSTGPHGERQENHPKENP
ncbi:nitrate- and nitrite sensing domain-containing protein [Streptomyces sp. NPDC099088]|uniref:nitrate- and nitrite sensing domain-containing protein n=1 Tax=Streptomyces sp. NPDC099088 TaxID=3366101 RepID=UPI00380BACE9